jgi:NTP pyrophosphatase (non-canonical NTP hydrolase)
MTRGPKRGFAWCGEHARLIAWQGRVEVTLLRAPDRMMSLTAAEVDELVRALPDSVEEVPEPWEALRDAEGLDESDARRMADVVLRAKAATR